MDITITSDRALDQLHALRPQADTTFETGTGVRHAVISQDMKDKIALQEQTFGKGTPLRIYLERATRAGNKNDHIGIPDSHREERRVL